MKTFIYLLILFCVTTSATSQSVFWEVSGNGLDRPSYLYGTMHLYDPALFDIGDSVNYAIDQSDAFAIEIDIDSLLESICEQLRKSREGGATTVDHFERTPKSRRRASEMPVRLDPYLYLLAQRKGKALCGLEPVSNQLSVDDANEYTADEFYRFLKSRQFKEIRKAYLKGDIDFFDGLASGGEFDSVMTMRNNCMVNSFITITQHASLFAAVGAAHLPGKYGLIAQLRELGYQVRPMARGIQRGIDYSVFSELNNNWVWLDRAEDGFRVELPGNPCRSDDSTQILFEYIDPLTEHYYGVGMRLGDVEVTPEALKSEMEKNMSASTGSGKVKGTLLSRQGAKGFEIESSVEGIDYYYRFLFHKGRVYYVFFANSSGHRVDVQFERFVESLELVDIDVSWKPYINSTGAFALDMPGNPAAEDLKRSLEVGGEERDVIMHTYRSTAEEGNVQYIARYYDMPAGTFIENEPLAYSSFDTTLANLYGLKEMQCVDTPAYRGYQGLKKCWHLNNGLSARYMMLQRGNRNYLLFAVAANDSLFDERFFNSFELLNFVAPELVNVSLENGALTLALPPNYKVEVDSSYFQYAYVDTYTMTCTASDDKSSATMVLTYILQSPYDSIGRNEDLLEEVRSNLDSSRLILHCDRVKHDSLDAVRVVAQLPLSSLVEVYDVTYYKRLKLEYRLLIPRELMDSKLPDSLMSLLKFQKFPEMYEGVSKTQLLLQDLESQDSLVREKAGNAIRRIRFNEEDLPMLRPLAQKDWPDDESSRGVRSYLYQALARHGSVADLPPTEALIDTGAVLRPFVGGLLRGLLFVGTQKSIERFMEIIGERTFDDPYMAWYYIFYPLTDSVEIVAENMDVLLPLISHPQASGEFLSILNTALQDSIQTIRTGVKNNLPYIHEVFDKHLEEFTAPDSVAQNDNLVDGIMSLARIIIEVEDSVSAAHLLERVVVLDNSFLRSTAARLQLQKGYTPDTAILKQILSDTTWAPSFLLDLVGDSLLHVLPEQLYKEEDIAYFDLFNLLQEDYDDIILERLDDWSMEYNGSDVKVYVYRFKLDDDEWHIGISGPYPMGYALYGYNTFTDYSMTPLEDGNKDEIINSILARYLDE